MRTQRGFTFLELFIVVAIIALIAALAIPALTRARVYNVTNPFKTHFGVDITMYCTERISQPYDQWLTTKQKDALRPYVAKRLTELCSTAKSSEDPALALDPAAAQLRLKAIHDEGATGESKAKACSEAKTASLQLGILTAEAP